MRSHRKNEYASISWITFKKMEKIASGETITEIVKKYKTNNWIGLIGACVSLEIIENSSNEMVNLNIPFGFKANLVEC